jgi:hypothetical protein
MRLIQKAVLAASAICFAIGVRIALDNYNSVSQKQTTTMSDLDNIGATEANLKEPRAEGPKTSVPLPVPRPFEIEIADRLRAQKIHNLLAGGTLTELILVRGQIENQYRALQLNLAFVGGLRNGDSKEREALVLQLRSQVQTLIEMRNINERMLRVGLGESSAEEQGTTTTSDGVLGLIRKYLSDSSATWIGVAIALLVLLFGDGWIKKHVRALRARRHGAKSKQPSSESQPSQPADLVLANAGVPRSRHLRSIRREKN